MQQEDKAKETGKGKKTVESSKDIDFNLLTNVIKFLNL